MTDPVLDQARAATSEARDMMAAALGLDQHRPTRGTSPLFDELWEQYALAARCEHLHTRPVQPWLLTLPWVMWLCRACGGEFSTQMRGTSLGPIEEFTCDRCRRYVRSLTPTVIRQDFWTIFLSLCRRCEQHALNHGAEKTGGAL